MRRTSGYAASFVYMQDLQDAEEMSVECDGFITPDPRRGSIARQTQRTFQNTPLPFVKMLLELRRKGMVLAKAHMGNFLEERLLT